ncbi:MAG TPA: methylated-DNA--[protein]-cysteine S-methyltransferase [Candidatus Peribacteraceae bacterium]|nr:methylated-DNA--[protein]-cysteine S-methyltransferase [Candidatus Peribacteraceae bacterium]
MRFSSSSPTLLKTAVYASPIGAVLLVASDIGLREISFLSTNSEQEFSHDTGLDPFYDQIKEYFEGSRKQFDLPLDPVGTDFQKAVWTAATRIPYGQTVFYEDVARRIGSPLAMRAVGTALKMNPLWLVVPCHRVLPKSGGMGGYAGGVERKEWLLKHEQQHS